MIFFELKYFKTTGRFGSFYLNDEQNIFNQENPKILKILIQTLFFA
jgi:hypothetical protein